MYALSQAPSSLAPAEAAAVDAATRLLPSCYSDALDYCLAPEGWRGEQPDAPMDPSRCAQINAAYEVSPAAWNAMDAVVQSLPVLDCVCPEERPAAAGMPMLFVVGAGGVALGALLTAALKRR